MVVEWTHCWDDDGFLLGIALHQYWHEIDSKVYEAKRVMGLKVTNVEWTTSSVAHWYGDLYDKNQYDMPTID